MKWDRWNLDYRIIWYIRFGLKCGKDAFPLVWTCGFENKALINVFLQGFFETMLLQLLRQRLEVHCSETPIEPGRKVTVAYKFVLGSCTRLHGT